MFLQICRKLNFPEESFSALENAYIRINQAAQNDLAAAHRSLFTPGDRSYLDQMQIISEKTGIHRYTSDMAVLVSAIEQLPLVYDRHGLSQELMWDSLEGLRYKLLECKQIYGIWGTFVPHWFQRFYILQCFKLGRLEFEMIAFKRDVPDIEKGTPVVNIHIPSCGPLLRVAVEESIALACRFYKDSFNGPIPFLCNSWMLYPPMAEQIIAPQSNLQDFYRRFTILQQEADPENKDFWRIFGCPYKEDLDSIPVNTTLQRKLLAYLRSGNTMGTGLGVFYNE